MGIHRDPITGDEITAYELDQRYREFLDELDEVTIGTLTYSASRVLEAVDPIAYRVGFGAWLDGEIQGGRVTYESGE